MNIIKTSMALIILTFTLILTSCSGVSVDIGFLTQSNKDIAEITLNRITSAINSNDASKIVDIFSNSIQSENDLEQSAYKLIEFVQGDIISASFVDEVAIGDSQWIKGWKRRKDIQPTFSVSTSENNIYYIAIKECVRDDFDSNNVGITSLYIIDTKQMQDVCCVYRGDGEWKPGINFDKNIYPACK